ncbi:MAG: hypothetical protein LBU28_01915 [Spirochaetaceae bacterium]|jgi:hypothetical protein|nr:hypothetical protein [Spirochaetaceae bacterium]
MLNMVTVLKKTIPAAGLLFCAFAVSCFIRTAPEAEPAAGPVSNPTEFLPADYEETKPAATAAAGFMTLEELAEVERSSGFSRGMGFTESALRIKAGDYGGAMIATYKELFWMYAYGILAPEHIEDGLIAALSAYRNDAGTGPADPSTEASERLQTAILASQGILAFHRGQWAEARGILERLFTPEDEPDSFAQWMRLVCVLEGDGEPRTALAAYGAIRARYESFPAYWYRGARHAAGLIRNDYAEICINLASQGPYVEECRQIIAQGVGLSPELGKDIMSRMEIEDRVRQSLAAEDPGVLRDLCALLALPDNPYTLYAAGALRALAPVEGYREWFTGEASRASGRLAERLRYISKG